jgi:hypothetical protein
LGEAQHRRGRRVVDHPELGLLGRQRIARKSERADEQASDHEELNPRGRRHSGDRRKYAQLACLRMREIGRNERALQLHPTPKKIAINTSLIHRCKSTSSESGAGERAMEQVILSVYQARVGQPMAAVSAAMSSTPLMASLMNKPRNGGIA